MVSFVVSVTITIIILLLLVFIPVFYNYRKLSNDKFDNIVTSVMSNVDNVPTIKLIEKSNSKNIFQKLLSPTEYKIDFNVTMNTNDYTTVVPYYSDYNFGGKGLVIAAAGNRYRYVTGLYTNLYTIRKYHKSDIPVEIFYVGEQEKFPKNIEKLLLDLGSVKIIDLMSRINTNLNEEELRGYQTKPLSAICSSFSEVIVMDADALCFMDPYYLFKASGYDSNGMILFKDYVDCLSFISKDFIETIEIGTEKYCNYTGNFEIDSSCVVVNKERYWETLFIISIINVKSDKYHKSKNVLGDKDTWLIGSMFMNMNPYISYPSPYVLIDNNNKLVIGHLQSTEFSDGGMTKEMFTHYNNQKVLVNKVNLTNWKYAAIKNPKNGQEIKDGIELPKKILDCFNIGKDGMNILEKYIPKSLSNGVVSQNGVSKGLIP